LDSSAAIPSISIYQAEEKSLYACMKRSPPALTPPFKHASDCGPLVLERTQEKETRSMLPAGRAQKMTE
jgi:hypothetical protein